MMNSDTPHPLPEKLNGDAIIDDAQERALNLPLPTDSVAKAEGAASTPTLAEALLTAIWRIEDMLKGDDGQAWKEAEKALPGLKSALASQPTVESELARLRAKLKDSSDFEPKTCPEAHLQQEMREAAAPATTQARPAPVSRAFGFRVVGSEPARLDWVEAAPVAVDDRHMEAGRLIEVVELMHDHGRLIRKSNVDDGALQSSRSGRDAPIPMILHCPSCGMQHVDEADPPITVLEATLRANPLAMPATPRWDNPPHRSHKCHGCGTIWRPADVLTTGVKTIETKGKADTWAPGQGGGDAGAEACQDCGGSGVDGDVDDHGRTFDTPCGSCNGAGKTPEMVAALTQARNALLGLNMPMAAYQCDMRNNAIAAANKALINATPQPAAVPASQAVGELLKQLAQAPMFDTCPTRLLPQTEEGKRIDAWWMDYLRHIDSFIRERARTALATNKERG